MPGGSGGGIAAIAGAGGQSGASGGQSGAWGEQGGSGGMAGTVAMAGAGGGVEAGSSGIAGGGAGQGTGGAAGSDGGQGGTAGSAGAVAGAGGDAGADGSTPACQGAFQFTATAESGASKSLCDYQGDLLLIVNIAANCGFTSQLAGLAQLQNTYNAQGFNVLGFWNNQFLGQMGDPVRREQVKTDYGVNFPLFDETNVNPPDEHPLFTWLKAESGGGNVGWNFEKFLIARDGSLIQRYLTGSQPAAIDADIAAAL
jgi:glutathione peroxidase